MKVKERGKLLVIVSYSKEDIAVLCDEIYHFDEGSIVSVDKNMLVR